MIVPANEVHTALLPVRARAAATLGRAGIVAMRAAQVRTHLSAPAGLAECHIGVRRRDPGCHGDHIDRLYRAARGMCVSREAAEQLVRVTLARASKRRRFLHSADDIGYLFRVLRNTFLSGARFAHPATTREGSELYRAVASLPDPFRDALIAVDLMGLSYGEAASALRVREASVATNLHHGRQRVARMLAAESGEGFR